jgi:sRNA-binding carbon storage regulator CsrA
MQILKCRVGQASVVDGKATLKMPEVIGDKTGAAPETSEDVPVLRDEVLRQLSKAAQEALRTLPRADNK